MKKQIGVIFGSRSCEREVAIISAVQLMRHADPEKYDIIPVYIDEAGNWYTGEPLKEIGTYKPFNPDKKGIV
ncbi:MAG: D-alanine--D-alanine ligase, partial [Clostridia bacterium]|nr:D-alanine--D-alanine ligase [Clostridia bacterium]